MNWTETATFRAAVDLAPTGTPPLSLRWRREGVPIFDDGRYSGAATPVLTIANCNAGDAGRYDLLASDACTPLASHFASLTVILDCIETYANCDRSSTSPILNVMDFICFNNFFAAGHTYANCDGSTAPPVLNVNDFVCFVNRFVAGCE
ncbi:MAG: hypothetical protein JNM80_13060 [Phycisphaerae bacterium]|nr:hypothetical protein [Phycisphaerae bacterium]